MDSKEVGKVLGNIKEFEVKINSAYKMKYKNQEHILDTMQKFNRIDLLEFYKLYQMSDYYHVESLSKVISCLMDIKLQMFFIQEVEIGQYNSRVVDVAGSYEAIYDNEFTYLTKLNIDQNLIIKTRILLERIMNFIYILETKKQLESKKSKKKKFKSFVSENEKWSFLNDTLDRMYAFDDVFRTPEIHKFSNLRSMFTRGEDKNAESYCFNLIGSFRNEIYPNIILILKGHEPSIKSWSKTSESIDEKLQPFRRVPEWMEDTKSAKVLGDFKKTKRMEFIIGDKEPSKINEFLVNERTLNILLCHDSKYNNQGKLLEKAKKVWISCEEDEEEKVKKIIEEYINN